MTDVAPMKNPLWDKIFSLHTLLGCLSALALICSGSARFAPWADVLRQITLLLGGGAVTSAVAYQSPRQKAIMEAHDPTPVTAKPITAGTIIASKMPEVKP